MTRSLLVAGLAVAIGLTGAACVADDGDGAPGGGGLSSGEGDGGSAGTTPVAPTEFSLGVTEAGDQAAFQVRVDGADPAPPIKYENDWLISVLDADGELATDAELFFVEPFMPAHGHNGTFEPEITPGDEPGTFDVRRINLWMGGNWEVRFFIRDGEVEDRVVIGVFIED